MNGTRRTILASLATCAAAGAVTPLAACGANTQSVPQAAKQPVTLRHALNTGATGFQNTWGFVTGSAVSLYTNVYGFLVGTGGVIAEGSAFKYASRTQSQTP